MITRSLAVLLTSLSSLLTLGCSSPDPGFKSTGGEILESATSTFVEPERYVLQQPLDFTMTLTTTSVGGTFGRLDKKHSCERGDTSPHVAWNGVPDGTKSLALVMEDPASDVHGLTVDVLWTHWVVYSIPPEVTELAVGQVSGELLENGAKQGANDYERVQYNGPCPIPTMKFSPIPHGAELGRKVAEERPYSFRIYALDILDDLPPGSNRDTLLQSFDGHFLAAGELLVNYKSTNSINCPYAIGRASRDGHNNLSLDEATSTCVEKWISSRTSPR